MNIPYAFAPEIWPSVIAILIFLVMAVYSIKNRGVPGALPFAFACVFGLLWTFGLGMETAAVNLETKIFWHQFTVLWQLPSTTAILCFILDYAQPGRWLTQRNLVLLSIVPLLSIILSITNNSHHLFWAGFQFSDVLLPIQTPILKGFIAYGYLLGIINFTVLIWLFIRSPQNRWPVVIIFLGQIFVRLLISLEVIFQIRLRFPFVGFGLVLISIVYAVVIFRFQILGPMPLARQVVLEQIPIGLVVLDDQKRVSSLNSAAEQMLQVNKKTTKGRPIRDVLNAYPKQDLPENCDHQFEFKLDIGDQVLDYQLDIIPLLDWRGLHVGQLLLLTDVTEQRQAQAQILEQGRVLATLQERELLARELHDDLAQVLAFINTQGQTVRRLIARGDLETADQYMQQLIEATRGGEVDLRESINAMRMTLSEHGLIGTLQKQLDQFERAHGIHTELIGSEAFNETLLAPMVEIQLLRILGEAFSNIRKHAQANQVRVKFDIINHLVCVTVKDNGQGFNQAESAIDREKHFGLQMMRERTAAIGGTINMRSQPGSGTEIRLCVPSDGKTVLK